MNSARRVSHTTEYTMKITYIILSVLFLASVCKYLFLYCVFNVPSVTNVNCYAIHFSIISNVRLLIHIFNNKPKVRSAKWQTITVQKND
mgnify:CR=1 FL=1